MEDNRDDKARSALDRRKFLGALGATAAAGVFLKSGGRAEAASTTPPTPLYQNLYGNVVPVNPATLAAGIPAPPSQQTRPEGSGATYVTDAYAQPNFLLIMVDQMAAPRWLPAHMLTNISSIASQACYFPNYFPAATSCTPSRATLLTGLYSQQTCMFSTLQNSCEPQLLPYTQGGFPTIGDVLSQSAVGYDTVWIGKWHLSATGSYGNCGTDLTAGPSAYGFTDQYSVPNNSPTTLYTPTIPQVDPNPLAYPSPDGSLANEGSVGALQAPVEWPDPYPYPSNQSDYPPYQATNYVYQFSGTIGSPPAVTQPTYLALGDGAIASMFEAWLSHAEEKLTTTPWFCAVSFVNPHDMTTFPYGFGITPSTENMGTFNFPTPIPESLGYTPPPTTGYTGGEPAENVVVFPSPVPFAQGSSGPTGPNSQPWNCVSTDSPKNLQYGTAAPHGKPTLQYWYQNEHYSEVGAPGNTNAWLTFLNYYYWLQINVDYQVGQVMNALNGSESFNSSNTIVIFTSDHGDYSGSHYLPGKGWGLYDESINVPLYIRMLNQTSSQRYPYACSSVDILPFLYDMALGNYSWRSNPSDIVEYLGHREVIRDFIYSMSPVLQQRLSNIPWANPGRGSLPDRSSRTSCTRQTRASINTTIPRTIATRYRAMPSRSAQ
jgi:arylsulfatase A-like enzyme